MCRFDAIKFVSFNTKVQQTNLIAYHNCLHYMTIITLLLYKNNNILCAGYHPAGRRLRKSKWDPDPTTTAVPGFPLVLPLITHKEQLDALLRM